MTDFTRLSLEERDEVALVTLRRPRALNAIDTVMAEELAAVLDRIEASEARALVLAGEGRAFSVGSDLKEADVDGAARIDRMHALVLRLADFPKTSVAAIAGLALGGGLEIALACTFRVAGPGARFGLPEIRLALLPAYGATRLLPPLIGEARALRMMLSGDPIDAGEAAALGLVEEIAEDPVAAGIALARRCSGPGDRARLLIRRAVREGATLGLADALGIEKRHALANAADPDVAAALAAFRHRG